MAPFARCRQFALGSVVVAMITMAGCQTETEPEGARDRASENQGPVHLEWLDAAFETTTGTLKDETFQLALAMEPERRERGLAFVREIPEDAGMLFVFPEPRYLTIVMRDCLVDIDLAFLSETGTIGRIYTMPIEPLRTLSETPAGYERRLKKYPSRFPARFALEVRAGTFERLGLEIGDRVPIEGFEALKERAE